METFKGFTSDHVKVVNNFVRGCMENELRHDDFLATSKVKTNNNEDDTIWLGRYFIIKDENGKFQAHMVNPKFNRESGWEDNEVELGKPCSFQDALRAVAMESLSAQIDGFFQNEENGLA